MDRPARFGISKLDHYLGGGIERSSLGVLIGENGTGKTLLAMQWLAEGVRNGENCRYISTTVPVKRVRGYYSTMECFADVIDDIDMLDVEIDVKELMPLTHKKIEEWATSKGFGRDVEVDRLVFDSITSIEMVIADPALFRNLLSMLAHIITHSDSERTILLTEEKPFGVESLGETRNFAECVILFGMIPVEYGLVRAMRIYKRFGVRHPIHWMPFDITSKGIELREGRIVKKTTEYMYIGETVLDVEESKLWRVE